MTRTERGNGGFTLLEVLVAMLLLVIIAGALYSSYFTVLRARERAEEGGEQRRELRGTLDLLRREIDGAFYRTSDKRLRFVVNDRDIFGKPASTLELVTVAPPSAEERPASDLVLVKYEVKEKEKRLSLNREATDLFGSMKPIPYPQMDEIEGFLVECYDSGKWVRTWNTELSPKLPEQVRITLTVRDGEKTADYSVTAKPRLR
ncbi:GspJ family type II secretion system protein [Geobacter grbiciae]|uniref:GspJ family type II secretion system protein n=1 Tax=Geobacter grbiciae TaxID=155042 RepID=UPI001C0090B6|nr:GspJ family type II secretion system protein [Geobacter grbiciae]MBT1074106.1 prepilin-type N-terminal cleavage/methylation domain-containing protein [Geobacter grbiciae]